jgi:hypothetical protein
VLSSAKGGERNRRLQNVRKHLNGQLTLGVYALNPKTQRTQRVAIDADYENALEDLLKLQWGLRQDAESPSPDSGKTGCAAMSLTNSATGCSTSARVRRFGADNVFSRSSSYFNTDTTPRTDVLLKRLLVNGGSN